MTALQMWSTETAIGPHRVRRARAVLITIIVVTCLIPLLFVTPDDAPWYVNVYKYLAKTGAFVGSMLLLWQFLLGFRGAVSSVLPDLSWVVDLHQRLGQFGVPIILLHPVFIGIYYAQQRQENIYALDLTTQFSQLVLLGIITLALVAAIILVSVLLKDRLGFYPWLYTHLSSYLIPPFLFVHSFLLGPTLQGTALQYYWWFFAALVALLYLHRLLHKLGVFSSRHTVVSTREVAESTTEIVLEPQGRPVDPAPGQFVYVRESLGHNSHPYTVSGHQGGPDWISITVQEEGPQSSRLQRISADDQLLVDGPYGVFTRLSRATDRPLVMIAGGIGITPFRRLWQSLEEQGSRPAHLFYANETFDQIVYREEIDALEHVQVVHVLNDEPDFDGEHGYVDVELLRRHLEGELTDHQFMICGPPPMILSLEEELGDAGVSGEQIAHELFAS